MKVLEPDLGMLLLVARRLFEQFANLDITVLNSLGGIIKILCVSLRFSGKCSHEVLLSLRSF